MSVGRKGNDFSHVNGARWVIDWCLPSFPYHFRCSFFNLRSKEKKSMHCNMTRVLVKFHIIASFEVIIECLRSLITFYMISFSLFSAISVCEIIILRDNKDMWKGGYNPSFIFNGAKWDFPLIDGYLRSIKQKPSLRLIFDGPCLLNSSTRFYAKKTKTFLFSNFHDKFSSTQTIKSNVKLPPLRTFFPQLLCTSQAKNIFEQVRTFRYFFF